MAAQPPKKVALGYGAVINQYTVVVLRHLLSRWYNKRLDRKQMTIHHFQFDVDQFASFGFIWHHKITWFSLTLRPTKIPNFAKRRIDTEAILSFQTSKVESHDMVINQTYGSTSLFPYGQSKTPGSQCSNHNIIKNITCCAASVARKPQWTWW